LALLIPPPPSSLEGVPWGQGCIASLGKDCGLWSKELVPACGRGRRLGHPGARMGAGRKGKVKYRKTRLRKEAQKGRNDGSTVRSW